MTSWDHLQVCQSLSRAGVPIKGQQIILPLHLLQGRLLGERSWKETRVKKPVVFHQCSCLGWETGAVRRVCTDPLHCFAQNLQVVGRGAWCGHQVWPFHLSGLLFWTKGSAHIRNTVSDGIAEALSLVVSWTTAWALLSPFSLKCDACCLRRRWGRWDVSEFWPLVGGCQEACRDSTWCFGPGSLGSLKS